MQTLQVIIQAQHSNFVQIQHTFCFTYMYICTCTCTFVAGLSSLCRYIMYMYEFSDLAIYCAIHMFSCPCNDHHLHVHVHVHVGDGISEAVTADNIMVQITEHNRGSRS